MTSSLIEPVSNLNYYIRWTDISVLLGLPTTLSLPARMRCPLCGGNNTFAIYHSIGRGCWHHCVACGKRGDMLDLLSDMNVESTRDVLRGLQQTGAYLGDLTDDVVKTYLQEYPVHRGKVNKVWEHAVDYYRSTTDASVFQIIDLLNLPAHDADNYNRGPYRVMGAMHDEQVRALSRLVSRIGIRRRVSQSLASLVFRWQTAPGLDAAIEFVTTPCRPCDRFFWKCSRESELHQPGKPGYVSYDVGFLGMQNMPDFDSHEVILTDNLTLFMRAQIKQAKHFLDRPPPYLRWKMSAVDRRLPNSWLNILDRPLIFWAPQLTPEIVIQASRVNGQVARVGPRSDTRAGWQRFFTMFNEQSSITQVIKRHAIPWRQALTNWVSKAADADVVRMTQGLSAFGYKLNDMVDTQTGVVLVPDCHIWNLRGRRKTSAHIEEMDGRWNINKGNNKAAEVFEGTIRLHKQVLMDRGMLRFIGEVRHGGKVYPYDFTGTQDRFRIMLGLVLKTANGPKLPNVRDLLGIVRAFSNTVTIDGLEKIGWDGHGFRLPAIDVVYGKLWQRDVDRAGKKVPGVRTDKQRTRLSIQEIKCLEHLCPETEIAWCLTVGLLRSLYTSKTYATGAPLLLAGTGLTFARTHGNERLGIPLTSETCFTEWPHSWPCSASVNEGGLGKFASLLKGSANQHLSVFLPSFAWAYALLADRYGILVDCRVPLNPRKTRHFPYEKLTLFGLQELTGLKREPENPTWEFVVGLVEQMLHKRGLASQALRDSRRWVVTPDQPDVFRRTVLELHLADMLECRFTASGELTCSRDEFVTALRRLTPLLTDVTLFPESVTISREQLDRAKGVAHGDLRGSTQKPAAGHRQAKRRIGVAGGVAAGR